jgi:hypothetical protein
MVRWLDRFLSGGIGLEQLRATFDRRTRTDGDALALKGASGAMFLNTLVKRADHPVMLARRLRAGLRVPETVDVATTRLAELIAAVAPPALPLGDTAGSDASPVAQPVHAGCRSPSGSSSISVDGMPPERPSECTT